ncbi:S9 family peptidase [Raineya orbicola]|uniref:Proline-specific endopeptidase n=1 Tax=Raineya orbicola TaxID=2016530 RepID=A0A2N3IKV8_9BACT|nr:S9 family peptidase [Raineya orbicola]PKQ70960.1 Protease II [Raineya orbicola]
MKHISLVFLLCIFMKAKSQNLQPIAPKAAIKPKELITHGHKRIDNYYWLNERENPEVIAYLKAENEYLEQMLAPSKVLREKLFEEIKGRIKEDDESLPYKYKGYYYYTRFEKGKEYAINCRKKGTLQAKEEILIDQNELAKGKKYFALGALSISTNNQIMAYATDTVGRRIYNIYFKDLSTGKNLPDVIQNVTGNIVWANDNKTLFYSRQDLQTLRSFQIYKHTLGSDSSKDELIYEEKDVQFSCYLGKSKSEKYLMIISSSTLSSETRYLDADKPNGSFKVFLPRQKDHLYSVSHFEDKFYIVTNLNAPNFKLMETAIKKTDDVSAWKEVIGHRKDVFLEDIEIFKDFLVVSERKAGLLNLRVIRWKDKSEHYLDFGEPAYTAYVSVNPDFDSKILRYGYTSFSTPNSIYDYDMEKRTKKLMKQQEVLGGKFDPKNYITERIYVEARDGAKIPVSIVYHKNTKKDGSAPLLQYAYGSYGASMDVYFSYSRLSLLDRGFIYALCHIRGGQEMGRAWYDNGKMFKKKNTFYDFIDCSIYLLENKYTSKDRLFAEGGSAGGLLMGAVANMRPDLYKGIIAKVPFVDVVTTMLDESIPLTTGEFDEWGNPKNIDSYIYMLSYSPYDQVEPQKYPHMLVTTGLHDSQVQYWEPAKWVAKLRTMKTDNNMLLLYTNMDAGHGGASGRFQAIKETALNYAFMFQILGIKE